MATIKKGSKAAKAKMAKVRAAKKLTSKVNKLKRKQLRKSGRDYQTSVKWTNSGGYLYPYNRAVDEEKKAQRPGKRVTDWGTTYYERRVNRSDAKGSLTGTIKGVHSKNLVNLKNLHNEVLELEKQKAKLKQKIAFNGKLGEHYYTKSEINKFKKDIIAINATIRKINKIADQHARFQGYLDKRNWI